jgi:beta-lactam-binding protein with PASTA domain
MHRTVIWVASAALLVSPATATAVASGNHAARASAAIRVPNLHCRRLDRAEDQLHRLGLKVRERGGGVFGIVVKSNWVVTSQSPRAGTSVAKGRRVTVYVDRSC